VVRPFADEVGAGDFTPAGIAAHPSIARRVGGRDLETDDLDRLAASHHHLVLCCGKPRFDKTVKHPPVEAVDEDEQSSVNAIPAAGEEL